MAKSFIDFPIPEESEVLPKRGWHPRAKKRLMNWLLGCTKVAARWASLPEENEVAEVTVKPTWPTRMTRWLSDWLRWFTPAPTYRLSVLEEAQDEVPPEAGWFLRAKSRLTRWWRRDAAVRAYWKWGPKPFDAAFRRAFCETLTCGMTGMRDCIPEEVLEATVVCVNYLFGYFSDGYWLPESVRITMLTYGGLVEQTVMGVGLTRRFCRTEQGRLGQVRAEAQEGDVFCVLLGAEVPYLLRPSPGKEGVYTLIGDTYLLGMMQGEALTDRRYETVNILIE